MKKIMTLTVLLLRVCFILSASDVDSLLSSATSFSNNKKVDKQITQQLKKISKPLALTTYIKADGVNTVEWLSNTECALKRDIAYTTSCGTTFTTIELRYGIKAADNSDSSIIRKGAVVTFLLHHKKMTMQKAALYQPRCEDGKFTPNSYNLLWFSNKGKQIQLL